MEEKRRKLSPEDKVKILRRHWVEKVPLSEQCDEYGLNPTVIYRWQKMLFENGTAALERRENGRTRKLENKVSALQAKLSLEEARRVVARFVEEYNATRLHSAIGYIAPKDKLEGRAETIFAERDAKLAAARERRAAQRRQQRRQQRDPLKPWLTNWERLGILRSAAETDAGSAGAQPARDNQLGGDGCPSGGVPQLPHPSSTAYPQPPPCLTKLNAPGPPGVA